MPEVSHRQFSEQGRLLLSYSGLKFALDYIVPGHNSV